MRIINKIHTYDSYKGGVFDCVIHGALIPSGSELDQIEELLRITVYHEDYGGSFYKDLALERWHEHKDRVCLGVTATDYLVSKLGTSGKYKYKRGNYVIIKRGENE